jgi:hypothetical protein
MKWFQNKSAAAIKCVQTGKSTGPNTNHQLSIIGNNLAWIVLFILTAIGTTPPDVVC